MVKQGISLKVKLAISLILLAIGALSSMTYLSITEFSQDKVAYIFDTSLSQTTASSKQWKNLFDDVKASLNDWIESNKDPIDQNILSAWGIYYSQDKGQTAILKKAVSNKVPESLDILNFVDRKIKSNPSSNYIFELIPENREYMLIGFKTPVKGQGKFIHIVSLVKNKGLIKDLLSPDLFNFYLVKGNKILTKPKNSPFEVKENVITKMIAASIKKLKSGNGSFEFKLNKEEVFLITKASVGFDNLSIISLVPKKVAFSAIEVLTKKLAALGGFFIFFVVFMSLLLSSNLTFSLKKLKSTAEEVASGNLDARADVKSNDEIGLLAHSFNDMADKIKALLEETKTKARMEEELKTAKLVQSTLFPEPEYEDSDIKILGFYEPAFECSGDWWFYNKVGNKTYTWIGDATGHGAGSALVTSAARSAAEVIKNSHGETPINKILELMNHSIYAVSKGKVMMTFFIGCYDHSTKEYQFANASHNPPYLLRAASKPIKKRSLEFLDGTPGSRLGEDLNASYEISTTTLEPGDRVFLFTDGVIELENESGEQWGERPFIKNILKSFNDFESPEDAINHLQNEMLDFQQTYHLVDDVTYFTLDVK